MTDDARMLGGGSPFAVDWLEVRSRLSPDKVALIDAADGGRAMTYGEWNAQANRTARFLSERLDVGFGDRVAVLARNCLEYLDIWFALGKIGAILQNLNWRLTASELSQIVDDAGPTTLIFDDACASLARSLSLKQKVKFVKLGGESVDAETVSFVERESFPARKPSVAPFSAERIWVICYTGGSTGLPKGAMLSHRAILANAVNTVFSWGVRADDRALLNAPLFHTGGLNVLTAPLACVGGASVVCQGFEVEQTFDLIEKGEVNLFFGVPSMFVMMQAHPRWRDADFGGLRFVISGGAPCPAPVFEKFWEKGVEFKTGYGLTEAGPNTFWLPAEDVRRKPGFVGYPLFSIEARIAKESGDDPAPEDIGELLVRGPHLFSGYWNNPKATAEAVDAHGWLHTGDLALRDAEGRFCIVGRVKEMIISGGENVFPSEIESALHAFEAIAEAAVIGVPDPKWGEVGCAYVALKIGETATSQAILDFCRERLASYKLPKYIRFLSQLPKTGANKIDKLTLRNMFEGEGANAAN
jgi:fatty-acyl-CoA synthase